MKPAPIQILVMFIFVFGISWAQPPSNLCTTKQRNFAEKQTEFMYCAVMNAEPVEYCIKCSLAYLSFLSSYDDLMSTFMMQNTKNVSCRLLIVDNDRLNLIENINAYTRNLWNMGFCSDCYDCAIESTPINCKLTNETIEFNEKFNATSQCISTNLIEPCIDCLSAYQTLNNFYDGIRAIKGDKFCFDTRDKMNKTRILWSNQLHCCGHRDSSKLIFFGLASAVISIMIAFYLGICMFEKRVERRYFTVTNDVLVDSSDAISTSQNDLNKPSTSSHEATNRRNRHRNAESSGDMDDDDNVGPIHKPNLINI